MKIEVYQDVWDALEDDPVERERLKMRSRLMTALKIRIKSWHVTRTKAAKRMGIARQWLASRFFESLHPLRARCRKSD
jgi:predicted XRE-type DNA-binding protein